MGTSSKSESEGQGVSSEDEVGEDNQSEEEVVVSKEDAEPIPDILFVPQRRSMARGFASLDSVDLEQVFEVNEICDQIHERSISRSIEGQFGGDQEVTS